MEDIAKRLGLSKGTIYLYFNSKEALFLAICEHYLKAVRDQQYSAIFSKKEDLVLDSEHFTKTFAGWSRARMGSCSRWWIDVNGLASAVVALYDGPTVSKKLGISEASNKKAWVEMVRAVMEGIGG